MIKKCDKNNDSVLSLDEIAEGIKTSPYLHKYVTTPLSDYGDSWIPYSYIFLGLSKMLVGSKPGFSISKLLNLTGPIPDLARNWSSLLVTYYSCLCDSLHTVDLWQKIIDKNSNFLLSRSPLLAFLAVETRGHLQKHRNRKVLFKTNLFCVPIIYGLVWNSSVKFNTKWLVLVS